MKSQIMISSTAKKFWPKFQLILIVVLALILLCLGAHKLSIFIITGYVTAFRPDQCESSVKNTRQPIVDTIFALDAVFTKLNISYVVSDGTAIAVATQSAINPWERVKYIVQYTVYYKYTDEHAKKSKSVESLDIYHI